MSAAMVLACPHCHVLNRVPNQRLADGPKCGRCHQPMFTGQALSLDAKSYAAHAQRSELPLLVDFWAPWCGPCVSMAPQFERAAVELEPQVRLAKIDTQAHPELGQRHDVRSIPTLILFIGGQEQARQSGAMSAGDIVRWTRGLLSI